MESMNRKSNVSSDENSSKSIAPLPGQSVPWLGHRALPSPPPSARGPTKSTAAVLPPTTFITCGSRYKNETRPWKGERVKAARIQQTNSNKNEPEVSKRPTSNGSGYVSSASDATVAARLASGQHPPNRAMPSSSNDSLSKIYDEVGCSDQDTIGAPCSPLIRTSGVARRGYIQLQASFFTKRFSTSSLTSDQNIYNTFHSPDGTIRCSTEHVSGGDFGSQRYSMTSSSGLASPPLYDAVRIPKRESDDYSNSSSSCSLATYDHRTVGSAGKRSVTPESSCSPVERPLRPACGVRIAELRANRKHDSDPASSSVSPSPEPLTTTATLFNHASATPAISRMSSVGDGTYGQRQIGPIPLVVPRTPQLDFRRSQRSSLDVNVTYVEKFVEVNQERCSNKRGDLAEEVRTMYEARQTRMRPLNLQRPPRLLSDTKPPIEPANSGNLAKRVAVKSGNCIGPNVVVDAPEKLGSKETVLANAGCKRTGLRSSAVSLNSSRNRVPLASPTSKSRFPASDFIPGSDVTSDDDSSCASGSCFSSESDKNGFRLGYRRIRSDVDDEISSEFEDNDHCNNYLKNSNSRACDPDHSSPDTRMLVDRCSNDAKLPFETEDNLRCQIQPDYNMKNLSYREPSIYATEKLNNIQRIGNFGQMSPEIDVQRKPDHVNNNNQDLCNTSTVSKAGYRSKIPSPNNLKTKVPTKSGLPNKVPLSPAPKRNTYVSGLAQKRTLKVPMSPTADRRPLNSPTNPCSSSSDVPAKPVGKRTPCLVRRTSNTVAPGLKRLSATCENVASLYSTPNSPPSPVDTTLKSGASLQQESKENISENFDCIPEGTLVESSKRSHASVSPRVSSISTARNPFSSAIQRSTSMSKISSLKNSKCLEKTPARTDKRPSITEDGSRLKKAPSRSDGLSKIGRATSHSNIFAKTKEIQKLIAHDSKETSRSTAVISAATKCPDHKSENSDSSKFNQSPCSSDTSENAAIASKDSIVHNKDMTIQNKDRAMQNKDRMEQNKDRSIIQSKCTTTCKENVVNERNSVIENDRAPALPNSSKLKNPQAGREKLANPRTESNVAHKEIFSSLTGTHAKPMIPIKHVKPYSSTTSNYHHSSITDKLATKNKASSGTVLKSESRNIQQSSIDEEPVQRTSADIDTTIGRVEPSQSAVAEVTLRSLLVPPGLLKQEEKDNSRSAGTFHSAKLDSTSVPASYCEPKTEEHTRAESNNVKDPDEREFRDSVSDDLKIGQSRSSPVCVADSTASLTGDCCNRHEESLFSRLNNTQPDPRTYQIVEIRACSLSARNSGDGSSASTGNVCVADDPSRETDKFQEISPDQHLATASEHQCKQISSNDAETKSTSKDNLSGDGLGSYTKKSNESAERLCPEKIIPESPKSKCTDYDHTHVNKMLVEHPDCDMVDMQASEGKLSGSVDFRHNLSNDDINGKRKSLRKSTESFPDMEVKPDENNPVDGTSGIKITFNHDVAYCNSDKYIVAYQNEDTIVLKRASTVHDGDLRSSKLSIAEENRSERCQPKPEVRLRPSKSPEYRKNLMSPRTELGNLPLSESGYDSWKSQSSESSSRLGKPHFDQFLRYGDRRKVNEAVLKRYSLVEFSSAQLENQRKFSMNCLSYQNIDLCKLSNLLSQTTTKNHKFSSTDMIQGESSSITDNDADMYENSSVSEVNSIGTVCKHSHSQNMGAPTVEDERRPSSSEGNSLSLSASHCSSLVEDQYLPFMDGHFDNSLADAVFGSFPGDMNDTFSKGNDSFSPSVSSSPSGSNADFLELELKEESLASGNVLLDPMQEMPPSNLFECDDDGLASMDQTSAAETSSRTPGHLEDFSSKNYYKLDFGNNDGDLMNLDPEPKSPTNYNVDEFWLNFYCPVLEDTSALPVTDKSSNAQWIPDADGLLSSELVTTTKLQNFESVINARIPTNRNPSVSFGRSERGTCYESVCDQLLESLQANLSDSENSPPLSLESSFNHKSNEFSYNPKNEEFVTVENVLSSEKESSADRVVLNGALALVVKDSHCEVTPHSNYRVAQNVDKRVTIETISLTENSNEDKFSCSPTTNAGESNSIAAQIPIHEDIIRDCQQEVPTVSTKSFLEENTSITTAFDASSTEVTLTCGPPSKNCELDVAVEMNQVQTGINDVEKFTTVKSLGDKKNELPCDKSEPDGQDVNIIGNEKLQTPQITTQVPNTSNNTTNEHQRSDGTGQEIKRPDHTEPVPSRPDSPTHEPRHPNSITHELQKPNINKYNVHRAYSTEHEPDRSESAKQELKRSNSLTHEIPVLFQKPFHRVPTVIRSSLEECELNQSSSPDGSTGLQKHTANNHLEGRKNSATERTEVNSVKEAIKKFEEQNASHGDLGKKDVQTNVIGKKLKTGLRLYSPFSKVPNGGVNSENKHITAHETNSTQPTKLKPVVPHSDGNSSTHVPSSPSCTEPSSPKKSSANIPISLAQKPPSPKPKTLIPSLFHRASVPALKHNIHEPLKQPDSKNNDNTNANASKTKTTVTTKLPSSLPSPRTTARHNFFFNRRSSAVLK